MRRLPLLFLSLVGCIGITRVAFGHAGEHASPDRPWWTSWSWDPWALGVLALSAGLYLAGMRRLRQRSRAAHRWQAAASWAGWSALVVALVSPVDSLGTVLFSVHMVQHEVLMLLAAPLLVLGSPVATFLWSLPRAWRRGVGTPARLRWVRLAWRSVARPALAWSVHALVLWIWHAPALFEASLASDLIHTLQHTSFLLSALLFWWVVLARPQGEAASGVGVLCVFVTLLHTGVLGAFLTFAPTVWYPAYAGRTVAWGLTPLEDQQLGGLIMWVPAGAVYLAAGLALVGRTLREADARVQRQERRPLFNA